MKPIIILIGISVLIGCTKINKNSNSKYEETLQQTNEITNLDDCMNHLYISALGVQKDREINQSKLFCNRYIETKSEIILFFKNHPEYLDSREKENALFNEYLEVLKTKKDITMYETLSIAHRNINNINMVNKNSHNIQKVKDSVTKEANFTDNILTDKKVDDSESGDKIINETSATDKTLTDKKVDDKESRDKIINETSASDKILTDNKSYGNNNHIIKETSLIDKTSMNENTDGDKEINNNVIKMTNITE